jgi:hypothetical protein
MWGSLAVRQYAPVWRLAPLASPARVNCMVLVRNRLILAACAAAASSPDESRRKLARKLLNIFHPLFDQPKLAGEI